MDDFERLTRKRFNDMLESRGYSHVKTWVAQMGEEDAFRRFIEQPYFAQMSQRLRRSSEAKVIPLLSKGARKRVS